MMLFNIKVLYICIVGFFDIRKLLRMFMKFKFLKKILKNCFLILKKIVKFLILDIDIFYNIKNLNF